MAKMVMVLMAISAVLLSIAIQRAGAQVSFPPASAPAPASDGASVDQGIAYLLMLVALVITYLIH